MSREGSIAATDNNLRLWLFDFDNTLAALEREVDWAASRRELEPFLRGEGVGDSIFVEFPKGNLLLYDELRLRLMSSADRADIDERACSNPETLLQRASSIIESYELCGVERASPLPGAKDLLRTLATHNKVISIVTSNSSRTVARWLELHQVGAFVSTIVGRDSLLALKPSPAMVLRALELNAATPLDGVFVGDSQADAYAARAAGVGFLGVAVSCEARRRLTDANVGQVYESPARLAAAMGLVDGNRG